MCDLAKKVFNEEIAEAEARGKVEGKIEVFHQELGLSIPEIAEKLNISESKVKEVLKL